MDFYEFLWFPWIPMDSCGFLWIPMYSYGFLCMPTGFICITMDSYFFLCNSYDSYGFLQDSYGFVCIPMDSSEFAWIPMCYWGPGKRNLVKRPHTLPGLSGSFPDWAPLRSCAYQCSFLLLCLFCFQGFLSSCWALRWPPPNCVDLCWFRSFPFASFDHRHLRENNNGLFFFLVAFLQETILVGINKLGMTIPRARCTGKYPCQRSTP